MLYVIDDLDVSVLSSGAFGYAVENLLRSFREGRNIIVGSRRCLEAITNNSYLSGAARTAAERLVAQLPQWAALKNDLSIYCEVTDGPEAVSVRDGQTVFRLNFQRLSAGALPSVPIVLGENRVDADLLHSLAKALCVLLRWNISVRCETRGGGGTTSDQEFEAAVASGRFVLAVVDSDQDHHGCEFGDTCKKVLAKRVKIGFCTSYIHIGNARELENMIPASVLESAAGALGYESWRQATERAGLSEIVLFADVKSGMTYERVCELARRSDSWRRYQAISKGMISSTCASVAACPNPGRCTCRAVPAVGRKALASVLAAGGRAHSESASLASEELRDAMKLVASVGCALDPFYV